MEKETLWSLLYAEHLKYVQAYYEKELVAHGFERLVIFAGRLHPLFLDDMHYPFKVNPHFKAWLPILDNPHCWLMIEPGTKPKLLYYQPVDYWHKVASDPTGDWVAHFQIQLIKKPEQALDLIKSAKKTAFIGEWDESLQDVPFAAINPQPLLHALHWQRAYKTKYEQECMRAASARAAKGHCAAKAAFFADKSTLDIHLDYLRATQHMEHELPYNNIITINENAAVLHYNECHHFVVPADERRSFLIDAGASFHGYAADITRTYAYRAGEFHDLITAMDEAQQSIVAAVRIGDSYVDLNFLAHHKIAEILRQFDFVRLSPDVCIEQGISRVFFAHGIGHLLGLQVHDAGGQQKNPAGERAIPPVQFPYLRFTRQIEANQVFTVEPGLYFIVSLLKELRASAQARAINWDKVEKFMPYGGIRIEDNILVQADGIENLTREAFDSIS